MPTVSNASSSEEKQSVASLQYKSYDDFCVVILRETIKARDWLPRNQIADEEKFQWMKHNFRVITRGTGIKLSLESRGKIN